MPPSITPTATATTTPTAANPAPVTDLATMGEQLLAAGGAGGGESAQDRRIYVGGLPYGLAEEHIRLPFSAFGTITNIDMPKDGLTGRSKGFCFVEYATKESCDVARSTMDGFSLGGRNIKVGRSTVPGSAPQVGMQAQIAQQQSENLAKKIAQIRAQAQKVLAVKQAVEAENKAKELAGEGELNPVVAEALTSLLQNQPSAVDNRIYVGHVMEEVTPEHLKAVFASFGEVISVWLSPDTANPEKHKGYGFIEFDNPTSATSAIKSMDGFELCGKELKVDRAHHHK